MKNTTSKLIGTTLLAGLSSGAFAQAITPDSYEASIKVGETITINKTITLPASGATNVDLFFLMDTTGSMSSIINNAKAGATTIMDALPSGYRFGVGQYNSDPVAESAPRATAFSQIVGLTSDKTAVQTGIDSLSACMFSCGGDGPEANFYALSTLAVGDTANGGNAAASWDASAQRIVVWFGDAESHTETINKADTITDLQSADVKVVAFNSSTAGNGIDGRYGTEPVTTNQASDIIAVTGGSLTNNFLSLSSSAFTDAVTAQISLASSVLDLNFGSTFLGDGLSISFTCTDVLGCSDVAGGSSRTFDVSITGLVPGDYAFDVFARGIAATESDIIHVTSVPEPETYAMLLAGLGLISFMSYRRRVS